MIWIFFEFTATQILREIKFWCHQTVEKCQSCQFLRSWIVIFSRFSNFSTTNIPNFKVQSFQNWQIWHFWTFSIHQNLISRKIWVAVELSNFNKVKALTSHFESFWSIVFGGNFWIKVGNTGLGNFSWQKWFFWKLHWWLISFGCYSMEGFAPFLVEHS